MELKIRYQYTYFIYPYIIEENNYNKYIQKLLKDPKCKMKNFEISKDLSIYQYFLPKIKDFMFWSFKYSKQEMRDLEGLDNELKANIISQYPCVMFEYNLEKIAQGKIKEQDDSLFFDISKIELICFNTGICFLLFKTILDGNKNLLSDVMDFNYKFRDITSRADKLKDYENIKIQTNAFKDAKEISKFIYKLTGTNNLAAELNLDKERFITYSYACISQENWNENSDNTSIEKMFFKFFKLLPAQKEINDITMEDYFNKAPSSKYIKYGFSNIGTTMLTSDINVENYTKLPFKFENEHLYLYILNLYKKIYLNKINYNLNKYNVQEEFTNFARDIWIEETTNDETGSQLEKNWFTKLGIDQLFNKIKNKCDILYKSSKLEKTKVRQNFIIFALIVIILIMLYGLIF